MHGGCMTEAETEGKLDLILVYRVILAVLFIKADGMVSRIQSVSLEIRTRMVNLDVLVYHTANHAVAKK
jgi:hypothetical protein